MNWINVEDQLPEKGESVLVATEFGLSIARLAGKTIIDEKPTWIEINGDYDFWNVTHWMPLPKWPKE